MSRPYSGFIEFSMTVNEAAAEAGVSIATMRRWAADGKVRASRHGRAWVIDKTSLPPATGLRRRIQTLIDRYSDDDNALWRDQVPYLVRTQIVKDLKEALGE